MQFNSIRFKASVLYSLILAGILTLFSLVIYLSIFRILYHNLDNELKIKAGEIAGILNAYEKIEHEEQYSLNSLLEVIHSEQNEVKQKMIIDDLWLSQIKVLNLNDDYINLVDFNGRATLHSNNFSEEIAGLFRGQMPVSGEYILFRTLKNEHYKYRAISLPADFQGVKVIVQVGTSTAEIDSILENVLLFMVTTVIALLILTSFVGRIFSDKVLKPVKEVADMADSITHKKLSGRIKEQKFDREMEHLVTSFNGLINRLEKSFQHINEFSSHTAHELKTPLAIIRGEIELALEGEKTSAYYKKVLVDNLEEIDRMIKVIKDLLILAKFEYKPEIFHFENLDMNALLTELEEQARILAEGKHISVTYHPLAERAQIVADKVHLRRLFHNIINNALKYTPVNGMIDIKAYAAHKKCHVEIKDSGIGIAEENLCKIFDKFYRVFHRDSEAEAGNGLGLSIAQSIAKAHQGEIRVSSQLGQGSTFTVILPMA